MGTDTPLRRYEVDVRATTKQFGRPVRRRRMMVLDKDMLAGAYGVHNNSLANLRRAVYERVFLVKDGAGGLMTCPKPARGAFRRLASFRRRVLRQLPVVAPMEEMAFASSYQGRKRKLYVAAVESLKQEAFLPRRDAKIKAFIKAEKTNFDAKTDPAPRIIQPRSPRFNVVVGKFLKPLEHHVYSSIDVCFGAPTVAKGRNADQRAVMLREAWDDFVNPVALSLDASRFDQHVSREALQYEHGFYLRPFGRDTELQRALAQQLRNRCTGVSDDGLIRYTTDGCRMSGDMNTSCGNVIIMCAMMYQWIDDVGTKARLINDGDDCVLITEKHDEQLFLASVMPWFLEFGFEMTVDAVSYVFEHIDFCQCRPVWAGDRWTMCRNPHTALDKDLLAVRPMGRVEWERQRSAVAACGRAVSDGLPLFRQVYDWLDAGRTDYEAHIRGGLKFLSQGLKDRERPVTDDSRVSFFKAWDLTPEEQVALEERYASRSSPVWEAPQIVPILSAQSLPTRNSA